MNHIGCLPHSTAITMQHYLHTVTSTVHSCLTIQFPFAHITHPRILKQEAFENLETLNLSVNAILVSPFHLSGMLSASLQNLTV